MQQKTLEQFSLNKIVQNESLRVYVLLVRNRYLVRNQVQGVRLNAQRYSMEQLIIKSSFLLGTLLEHSRNIKTALIAQICIHWWYRYVCSYRKGVKNVFQFLQRFENFAQNSGTIACISIEFHTLQLVYQGVYHILGI